MSVSDPWSSPSRGGDQPFIPAPQRLAMPKMHWGCGSKVLGPRESRGDRFSVMLLCMLALDVGEAPQPRTWPELLEDGAGEAGGSSSECIQVSTP